MRNMMKKLTDCFGAQGEPWYTEDNAGVLRILRTYHEKATTSEWLFPSGEEIVGLENPWLDNEQFVSCVKEGLYRVRKRKSQIVERTTNGKFKEGYELVGVPNRSNIIVHIGNYVDNTDGCPLTGMSIGEHEGIPCVWSSSDAFDIFMRLMEEEGIEYISIENKEEVA